MFCRLGQKNSAYHLAPEARGETRFYDDHGDYRKDALRGTLGQASFGLP